MVPNHEYVLCRAEILSVKVTYAEGGVDVDGARVTVPDEAEVVGAAGGRHPAVRHARPQVDLQVLPELAHLTPATFNVSVIK